MNAPSFRLSDSVRLRPLEEDDIDELYGLVDVNRSYLARWLPWAQNQTREGTIAFIRMAREQLQAESGFQVALLVDERIIGVVGYHAVDRQNLSTNIGYWLAEDSQGRGLMTAAVRVLVDHAFSEWGLHRVEIRAAPDNSRSRTLCRRLGFVEEGVLRGAERLGDRYNDLVVHSMLAPDWAGGGSNERR